MYLNDDPKIKALLNRSEWSTFDCKRAAIKPAQIMEHIIAFANSNGGLIVLGLEDPKKASGIDRLIGISENASNVADILDLARKNIVPPLNGLHFNEIEIINTKGAVDKLLLIQIDKSIDVHSLTNGDTFVRRGDKSVKIGAEEIIRIKYEKGTAKFEDQITDLDSLEELDQQLLEQYKFNNQSRETDNWLFLKDNGLALKRNEHYYLTNAGALLFSKNPTITLKRKCGIKISYYHGTTPNFSGEPNFRVRPFTIEGPLLSQIQEALKYYSQFVKQSAPKLVGATFQPTIMIPDWAFQEAITNAVIHRDYSIQDDIHVRFFDDHIEIESPGTYPANITVKNIRSERFARNSIIQRTLSRFNYAPNLDIGEGVDRMFKVMLENNLYEPLYYPPSTRPHTVLLVLFNTVKVEYWDIVSSYLDEHTTITNSEARKITGVNDTLKMSRYLNEWLEKGLLQKGGSTKTAFYTKVGVDLNQIIFSSTSDKSNG